MRDGDNQEPGRAAIRELAAQQGLERALAMFPEAVHDAVKRAGRPVSALPQGAASSEPAASFDVARIGAAG